MLDSLKLGTEMRRKAGEIYGAIVTQARQGEFYAELGVPDTPSGRYEMVVLHLFLVLERLRHVPQGDLARRLVEAFVSDMDDSLRELATGDLAVPKKVRKAAAGLYERSMDYRGALAPPAPAEALSTALARHVYDTADGDGGRRLAAYVRMAAGAASDAPLADFPAILQPAGSPA